MAIEINSNALKMHPFTSSTNKNIKGIGNSKIVIYSLSFNKYFPIVKVNVKNQKCQKTPYDSKSYEVI